MPDMETPHYKLANRYFNYLAKRFPVMCASDEFHFLPRAEDAAGYYDMTDNMDASSIEDTIIVLKEFQEEFINSAGHENELENLIDLELLKANAAGILIELEENRSWQHNPLLYLKIAFIGLDHAMTKPAAGLKDLYERTAARLNGIPRLMEQAVRNIGAVPDTHLRAAKAMLMDCERYLSETGNLLGADSPGSCPAALVNGLNKAESAIKSFGGFLDSISPVSDRHLSPVSLLSSLERHFLSRRKPDEVYRIAVDDWHENLRQLNKLQSKIDPGKTWAELYHAFSPPGIENMDTISLYREEIEGIGSFFCSNGFDKNDLQAPLEIMRTPVYLQSVRGTASFAAALSPDDSEKSYFYITPDLPGHSISKEDDRLKKRLHREYKFLTAHETIPGHHLIDSIRRRLKNPVRRQIESPLFYEGWATYAESLLAENGYIKEPIEYLVEYKRRLWRSARCQIDTGLPIKIIDMNDAAVLLTTAGFSSEEAGRQIYRFQLNPGYQLCYTLGRYEILQLKKTHEPGMGSERFHAFILEGGQLPFHLIEKRFMESGWKN